MKKRLPVLTLAFFLYLNFSIFTVNAAEVFINSDQEKLIVSKSLEIISNQEPGHQLKSEDIIVLNRSEEKYFRVSLSLEKDKFLEKNLSGKLIVKYGNKNHNYLLGDLEQGVLVNLLPNEKMTVCPLFELAGEPMKNDTQDQSAELEYKFTIEGDSPNKYDNTSKVDNIENEYRSLPKTGEKNNGLFVAGMILISSICFASINKKRTSKNRRV